MRSKAKAEVKASLVPAKSQVLLVALVVAGIFAVCCGTYLLSKGMDAGWGLVGVAVLIFLGSLWAWNKAQSDSDLENSHPTSVKLPDGTDLTTDSRTLRSLTSTYNLARLLQELLHRKPLPTPDALVNETLEPIPNSTEQAKAVVDKINENTQTESNHILDTLGLGSKDASHLQKLNETPPPHTDLLTTHSPNQSADPATSA
jgi:hypothetical protein